MKYVGGGLTVLLVMMIVLVSGQMGAQPPRPQQQLFFNANIVTMDDGRPQAEYEIVYKQNVSPEDMFLGVDPERHAGVSCSDALLLKVLLPGTKLADIELDVRETFVRVQAPRLKLKAWLPEKVDATKGNAKWDGDKETLAVTLPIIHDPLYGSVSASNEMD